MSTDCSKENSQPVVVLPANDAAFALVEGMAKFKYLASPPGTFGEVAKHLLERLTPSMIAPGSWLDL